MCVRERKKFSLDVRAVVLRRRHLRHFVVNPTQRRHRARGVLGRPGAAAGRHVGVQDGQQLRRHSVLVLYEKDVVDAIAIFLLAWTIFTFLMWLGTLRANIALSALFGFLTITFMLLSIADFRRSPTITRAAGSFGIITAIIAWHITLAGVLTHENSYFTLPVGSLGKH